jgi:hypothetical protein
MNGGEIKIGSARRGKKKKKEGRKKKIFLLECRI